MSRFRKATNRGGRGISPSKFRQQQNANGGTGRVRSINRPRPIGKRPLSLNRRRSVRVSWSHNDITTPNLSALPQNLRAEALNLMKAYMDNVHDLFGICPGECGGGIGSCGGVCANGSVGKDKWEFKLTWTF